MKNSKPEARPPRLHSLLMIYRNVLIDIGLITVTVRLADKAVQLSRVDTSARFKDILEALPSVPKSVFLNSLWHTLIFS